MDYVDLHVHSNASDGTCTPTEVVGLAARAGLKAIALTDHDTTAGIPEALLAGAACGVEVIPGIEVSSSYNTISTSKPASAISRAVCIPAIPPPITRALFVTGLSPAVRGALR